LKAAEQTWRSGDALAADNSVENFVGRMFKRLALVSNSHLAVVDEV